MLKIFISHTFSNEDQKLSSEFNQYLDENNMNGYLAEQQQEYTLLISDKIKNEIKSSDCLVAIITIDGLASASVHEEIGFSIGKDIPVILMVEKTIKENGVLIYGKEPEYFEKKFFKSHSEKVIQYIQKNIHKKKSQINDLAKEFLNKRNLLDVDSSDFSVNVQTELLQTTIDDKLIPHGKPFVLFSSCPNNLKDIVDVHTEEFQKYDYIKIQDNEIRFLDGSKKTDIDSINYIEKHGIDNTISKYSEFQNNGFIGQGISADLIRPRRIDNVLSATLNLCWLTGTFWAFLKFSKIYYEKIEMNEKFDVMLSIRNSKDLMLLGFGGVNENNQKWTEPYSDYWDVNKPKTTRDNILLKIESLDIHQMTDELIESKTREISNQIAYAYGLESSRCYNYDGSFNWELMNHYNRR